MQNYILSSDLSMCIAEDDFLSLPGDVLSNLWCRSPEKRLQREKGRYSLDRKEKVWQVTQQWVWVSVGVGVVPCVDTFNCFPFPRFCGKNGPDRLPIKGKSAAVVFKSDKKGNGGGADCTIACSDFSPTGQIHCKWYCIGKLVWTEHGFLLFICHLQKSTDSKTFQNHSKKQKSSYFWPTIPILCRICQFLIQIA